MNENIFVIEIDIISKIDMMEEFSIQTKEDGLYITFNVEERTELEEEFVLGFQALLVNIDVE